MGRVCCIGIQLKSFYKYMLCLFWSIPSLLMAGEPPFVVSYVDHKGIKSYYVPLVSAAYRQLGIEPIFKPVNDQRALWLLNQGSLDADTAKTLDSISNYTNIRVIPTSISKIEVLLICQVDIVCDLTLLSKPNKTLGVVAAEEFYQKILVNTKIKIKHVASFEQLHKLYHFSRVDAIITVLDQHSKQEFGNLGNYYMLEERLGFHLIHKRHEWLMQELDEAFRLVIENPQLIDFNDAVD